MFKKILAVSLILISLNAASFTLFSHRGARGLVPENTIPAIQKAIDLKVDAIDVDVVLSKDNQPMVYHDLTLNPDTTKDSNNNWVMNDIILRQLTAKQIQTYKVSKIKENSDYAKIFPEQATNIEAAIPSLREVIQYIKQYAGYPVILQIELKNEPQNLHLSASPEELVTAVNKVILQENFSKYSKVQAFDWRCLQLIASLNPIVDTGYLTSAENSQDMLNDDPKIAGFWTAGFLLKDYNYSIPAMIMALHGTWWDAEDIELSQNLISEAHKLGLKVAAWSWPEKTSKTDANTTMQNKLISFGIDGIITDRPDITAKLNVPLPNKMVP